MRRLVDVLSPALEIVADWLARILRWSAIGRDVVIVIDHSERGRLTGRRLYGTIRACAQEGGSSLFLIHLSDVLRHDGRSPSTHRQMLVVTSALRWHGANRLLLTWVAVLIMDAPSFVDQTYDRAFGTGRLMLV